MLQHLESINQIFLIINDRKYKHQHLTMYKNNSRVSSKIKGFIPLQLSCNLIGKFHAVGYYAYTKPMVCNPACGGVLSTAFLVKNATVSNTKLAYHRSRLTYFVFTFFPMRDKNYAIRLINSIHQAINKIGYKQIIPFFTNKFAKIIIFIATSSIATVSKHTKKHQ